MSAIRREIILGCFDKEEIDCYLCIVSKISVFINNTLVEANQNHVSSNLKSLTPDDVCVVVLFKKAKDLFFLQFSSKNIIFPFYLILEHHHFHRHHQCHSYCLVVTVLVLFYWISFVMLTKQDLLLLVTYFRFSYYYLPLKLVIASSSLVHFEYYTLRFITTSIVVIIFSFTW